MGFVRNCWEGVVIRRYRNEVKKSEDDPDFEYNLSHYHRIIYYERREKMKDDNNSNNSSSDNKVNVNTDIKIVKEEKHMENGSNDINGNL
jgi:hypothetical protein